MGEGRGDAGGGASAWFTAISLGRETTDITQKEGRRVCRQDVCVGSRQVAAKAEHTPARRGGHRTKTKHGAEHLERQSAGRRPCNVSADRHPRAHASP